MSSKPARPGAPSHPAYSLFKQFKEKLVNYLEMPSTDHPTLPQLLLAKTRLRSWPLASLTVGVGVYLIFLLLAWWEGLLNQDFDPQRLRTSLIFSVMIFYLLLIQPPLRLLLGNAIETYLPMLPANEYPQPLINQAFFLKRNQEWVAVGLGLGLGWFLDPPWTNVTSTAVLVYMLIGGGLVYGLTGWHIYAALVRTRLLAMMHHQIESTNLFEENAPHTPILSWILGVLTVLVGGIVVSFLFIDLENLRSISVVVTYSILVLAAGLILVFSKAPASLFTQVRVFRALFLFILVAGVGTAGFFYLEEWNFEQSLYATIITMTTVGYGDLTPTNTASRFFAIGLSLVAVGIAGYAVSAVAAIIVEGNIGRLIRGKRVYKLITRLDNHIILCGAGRIGRQIAIEFQKTHTPFVLIEQNPEVLDNLLREIEIPYLEGNATQDRVLALAGIKRARGLVTTFKDDKENAFVVLSARETAQMLKNPALRITTRINDEKQTRKLQQAGADAMISPKTVGARRMAGMMLDPTAFTFLDEMLQAEQQTGQTLRLEEVHVNRISLPILVEEIELNRLTVVSIGQHTGLLVVAIKRFEPEQDYYYLYTPRGNTEIKGDDILIVLGTPEERARLRDTEPPTTLDILQAAVGELRVPFAQRG